jgi:hypothetical protein
MSHYNDLCAQVRNTIDDCIRSLQACGCTYPGALSLLVHQTVLRMETAEEVQITLDYMQREIDERESVVDDDDADEEGIDADGAHPHLSS